MWVYKERVFIRMFKVIGMFGLSSIWASTQENLSLGVCKQQRRRTACASMQTDKHIRYSRLESIISEHAKSEVYYTSSIN